MIIIIAKTFSRCFFLAQIEMSFTRADHFIHKKASVFFLRPWHSLLLFLHILGKTSSTENHLQFNFNLLNLLLYIFSYLHAHFAFS